ncbi:MULTISPECIES: D-alanyl-D-alanine carboxypeptidase/D-alanyl-D-alanine endopeptidase [Mycolicibacterium]|uniref:D-alanyl-D-alanine carboxypeptidase, serine-type, PBP4 family n=1 Tax=Mycolicibacterium gilvum (strain DSM 45189 / LMG 24558 / Spyr1) TaxID=278137 RepID=E6TIH6_MYCSR|nr:MULTISPECIES: D-alanyl-D-alanine carboxypeptidase/D-alanyl-D-alanine-endopeptidase [Mycolicibacterium]ADU01304.1 D-alanyl-D-alanine carboxypeptidase, serine-type, PBP4 family [Mycolicibacterium gilvum Spyr1]MBV5243758.1 D-alanyl-D-alanine carboxypeptidase/D-alanyl-D-alanine-endopeptidase [Mycolicibacterium sp. PAM1]
MRPTGWRRSTYVVVGAVVALLVVVLVAAAALVAGRESDENVAVDPVPAPATADPGVIAVSDSADVPTERGLADALRGVAADPNLGRFTGRITDALTGKQLWAQGADVPMQPASTNKLLTAAAALVTLDRDARLTTRVVSTSPGVIVLVAGGDQTLSAAPAKEDTWYRDAARISDLADQVRRSGVDVRSVQVDVSFYTGPTMAPGWDPLDIDGGDIAPMEAIMLDGGRTQPVSVESRRSRTPALDAGRALATALRLDPAKVTVLPPGRSAPDGDEIASVQSAPLMERLRQMMHASDNVMAESIGREVADARNRPRSFAGAAQAVEDALDDAGIDTSGARLLDSSGLSVDNRLTAETLDEIIQAAAGESTPALRPLVDLLAIAGGSGTMSNRYHDTESGRAALGYLRAKTGSLTGTNTLAGIVTDESGRVLTFALLSNDAGPTGRTSLDAFAATLRSCGCR